MKFPTFHRRRLLILVAKSDFYIWKHSIDADFFLHHPTEKGPVSYSKPICGRFFRHSWFERHLHHPHHSSLAGRSVVAGKKKSRPTFPLFPVSTSCWTPTNPKNGKVDHARRPRPFVRTKWKSPNPQTVGAYYTYLMRTKKSDQFSLI